MPPLHVPSELIERPLRGILVTCDAEIQAMVSELDPVQNIEWVTFIHGNEALGYFFSEPPDIVLVDMVVGDMQGIDLVHMMKSENVYRQVPVALCLEQQALSRGIDWGTVEADDFLVRPFSPKEISARVSLILSRASRSFDANPLTHLPGNTSIIRFIQDQLNTGTEIAFGYADLDYFKSFNDKYGFSRGDEVLMMTARIIVNCINSSQSCVSFVGHVGGDDFVFALPKDKIESVCTRIVKIFDAIVPSFYDAEDRVRGGIISTDRGGQVQFFSLMSISLAVLINHQGRLTHYGEVSAIASELKKKAKTDPSSNYIVDRRCG